MPILSAEPAVFPESLLNTPLHEETSTGRWWAIYTRAKAEKALARHLFGRGVSYYLPLKQHSWRKEGRNFRSLLPVFPGYVFVHGDNDDRIAALESNMVSRVLDVPDQGRLWSDLRRVDRMLAGEVEVGPATEITIGEPVDIVAGPMQGLSGVVLRRGSQLRFIVEVAFLRQAVSIEVESWMLTPADKSHRVASFA